MGVFLFVADRNDRRTPNDHEQYDGAQTRDRVDDEPRRVDDQAVRRREGSSRFHTRRG